VQLQVHWYQCNHYDLCPTNQTTVLEKDFQKKFSEVHIGIVVVHKVEVDIRNLVEDRLVVGMMDIEFFEFEICSLQQGCESNLDTNDSEAEGVALYRCVAQLLNALHAVGNFGAELGEMGR